MSQSAVQNPEYLTEAPTFQKQEGAGQQHAMKPKPVFDTLYDGSPYKAAGKLEGKTALITGGDSGIGGAVAYLFALEGADVTIQYLPEEEQDAQNVKAEINKRAPKSNLLLIAADLKDEQTCKDLVAKHIQHHGGLDTLVLNHGTQYIQDDLSQMSTEQWLNTFSVNLHPHFYITREALNHLPKGGTITMNSSVNTFKGHPVLVDYTATKGAIVGFARALNVQVAGDKGIRVNVVAPGPIWTPLIVQSMPKENQEKFGTNVPMKRAGQPIEVATCFVFLASPDAGYMSGQVLHPNGGSSVA
ncbi:hypothetical protein FRC03_004212 [Tulasnella sp. 419]|nr:hypothetical protein FRC03_004212 [Tulasnella sp. 419]